MVGAKLAPFVFFFMRHIFFDLDGTLIDSKLDLANSINHTLKVFGLKPLENKKIYSFVGNGVRRLVEDCLKEEDAIDRFDAFMGYFLNYYAEHLLDNTVLYDGVYETLEKLKAKNIDLFVVSNKSFVFVKRILKGLNIERFFVDYVGGDSFPFKKPHPYPLLKLKEKYGLSFDAALMVGDSENDIEASRSCNIKMAWVSYGFRDKSLLDIYRVEYVINEPLDLLEIVF